MSFNFLGPFSSLSFHVFRYVLLFLTHSTLIKSTCYFPDGTPSEDIPCYTNSSVDYCCGKDSLCFENKVCLNNIGTFARGSCTDKAWNSPTCPVFCISGNSCIQLILIFSLMMLPKSRQRRPGQPNDCVPAAQFRNLVLWFITG